MQFQLLIQIRKMATIFCAMFLAFFILSLRISGQELDSTSQRRNVKPSIMTSHSNLPESSQMQEKDIKIAFMKEILSKLGMKDRPPPIPKDKRKQNIPRPVYDGGINIALQDVERAKETQVIIAAEEGNRNGCDGNEACFEFKLNHNLLREHLINYANLHIYNEADEIDSKGVFKTIKIKEIVVDKKSPKENDGNKENDGKRQGKQNRRSRGTLDGDEETSRPDGRRRSGEDELQPVIHDTEVIEEGDVESINGTERKRKQEMEKITKNQEHEDGDRNHKNCSITRGLGCQSTVNYQNITQKTEDVDENIGTSQGEEIELISTEILLSSKSWFKVNLKEAVLKWVQDEKTNSTVHVLRFICNNCQSRLKICNRPRYRPFIVIKITERIKRSERKRRSYAVNCVPGYEKCCRRRLYVNFKEIKWHDWIIEPAGFEVNYCEGRCTGTGVISAHNHAVVKQKLMGKKKHSYLTVCCVPVKFSSLTLLHYDDDGLIHTTVLKNMTVEKCGCV